MPGPFLIAPIDKQAHFFAGMAIALSAAIFGHIMIGLVFVVLAGILKEWVWDRMHPETHTIDVLDFTATAAGGLVGFFLALLARGIHD
jgi:predicted membrane protein